MGKKNPNTQSRTSRIPFAGGGGAQAGVLSFCGELTDESGIALIDEIRTLRDRFFFDAVRLRITSPGGACTALRYFADSVRELRREGMVVSTHAVATVASAAAVMLSIGDVRTAHPRARLLYHNGRIPPGAGGAAITANGAETVAASLRDTDAEIVSLLASRAALGPPPAADAPEAAFAADDWRIVERLGPGKGRGRGEALRRLRKRVARAFKATSKKRLAALYADLCALDAPMSPQLALELGLIDAVGDGRPTGKGCAAAVGDGLTVPEWEPLHPGGQVPRFALTRHTLILGETGSGKTASGVLPVVGAIMRPDSPVSCSLVIDPKGEIAPVVERLAGPGCDVRLLRADAESIDVMGRRSSVAEDVAQGRWLSAAQAMLARAASLSDSPARVLAGKAASSGNHAFWENEGSRLARCVLAFTLMLSRGDRLQSLLSRSVPWDDGRLREGLAVFGEFAGLPGRDGQEPPVNALALAQRAFEEFFVPDGHEALCATEVMDALASEPCAGTQFDEVRREAAHFARTAKAFNQYAGLMGEARCCFAAFADPAVSRSLLFGVEREAATVDFAPGIEADCAKGRRVVHVHQPALRSDGETLVAKALKAAFFEAVLTSPARRERGSAMPLALYVADEFQRFVTSDASHGEQSFLDACRAFGAGCVLATQSQASIRHALATAGEPSPDTAIAILLANTATKLAFRSTERGVRDMVGALCPGDGPDRVVAVRPPTTLRPGECYASLPDGRFERRQLRQFEPTG